MDYLDEQLQRLTTFTQISDVIDSVPDSVQVAMAVITTLRNLELLLERYPDLVYDDIVVALSAGLASATNALEQSDVTGAFETLGRIADMI